MRILYATDGSDGATAAARWLSALPLDADCTLATLTVAADHCRDSSDAVLSAAAKVLGHSTASLERQKRSGCPAAEIIQAADEQATDLIVLGSHGHSAVVRFLLGSVAERVARDAPCPVLLVRAPGHVPQRVVVGVDGSDGAGRAVRWLRHFPLPPGCEIRLVSVLPNLHEMARERVMLTPPLTETAIPLDQWQREDASSRLADLAASFTAAGMRAVTEIRSGDPASCLLEVAEDEGADLIVVGTHSQGPVERFLLGSVAQQVLCRAGCSVLVVRDRLRPVPLARGGEAAGGNLVLKV